MSRIFADHHWLLPVFWILAAYASVIYLRFRDLRRDSLRKQWGFKRGSVEWDHPELFLDTKPRKK